MTFRMPRPRRADPEGDLQREIVAELRLAGVDFCHVPNSTGRGGARRQGQLKALGVTAGVCDILIFDPPPLPQLMAPIPGAYPGAMRFSTCRVGACLELKAKDRASPVNPWDDRRASPEQREFLRRRHAQGWAVAVCGPAEARAQLVAWGYLR